MDIYVHNATGSLFYSCCVSYKMFDCFITARIGQARKNHSLEVVPVFTHPNRHELQNGKYVLCSSIVRNLPYLQSYLPNVATCLNEVRNFGP